MPLHINFSQQDLQTRLQQSQQAGHKIGYSEGLQRGIQEGIQQAATNALVRIRRFYQDLHYEISSDQNRFPLSGSETIENILLDCLRLMRVEHNTRRRLEKQVADEDRKLKLDMYSQKQEEIKCLKKQLEQQEQQLSNYEGTKTSLERQNAELNQTMVGLQNTLDRAFKQGK